MNVNVNIILCIFILFIYLIEPINYETFSLRNNLDSILDKLNYDVLKERYREYYIHSLLIYKDETEIKKIFLNNVNEIIDYNKNTNGLKFGITSFSFYKNEDFIKYYMGLKKPNDYTELDSDDYTELDSDDYTELDSDDYMYDILEYIKNNISHIDYKNNLEDILDDKILDYRTPNNKYKRAIVSPVKKQGPCGSCFAFASASLLESSYAKTHNLTLISIVYILSCFYNLFYNQCCNGGKSYNLINDIFHSNENGSQLISKKLEQTYNYSYFLKNCSDCGNDCIKLCDIKQDIKINEGPKWVNGVDKYNMWFGGTPIPIGWASTIDMIQILENHGPMVVNIDANSLQYYTGGIIVNNNYKTSYVFPHDKLNHEVIIIGYNYTKKYWIVQSSWGEGWGHNGIFYVSSETNNIKPSGKIDNSDGYYPDIDVPKLSDFGVLLINSACFYMICINPLPRSNNTICNICCPDYECKEVNEGGAIRKDLFECVPKPIPIKCNGIAVTECESHPFSGTSCDNQYVLEDGKYYQCNHDLYGICSDESRQKCIP